MGKVSWKERLGEGKARPCFWYDGLVKQISIMQTHSPRTTRSDHDPIHVELINTFISTKLFRFKFENM